MGFYVCWFIAAVEDAKAIRSIATTKARKLDEWPHLILPGVDGPDMNKAEKFVRPRRPKGSAKIGGVLLDRGKMTEEPFTAVSQMNPEYLEALVKLDETGLLAVAKQWSASIDRVSEEAAAKLLRSMAELAKTATKSGKPVLELVVM
ncbi:MAG: hypothetical protein U0792_19855 [Gemmataceae bacterium]